MIFKPQITQIKQIKKQGFAFGGEFGKPVVHCLNLFNLRNLRLNETEE